MAVAFFRRKNARSPDYFPELRNGKTVCLTSLGGVIFPSNKNSNNNGGKCECRGKISYAVLIFPLRVGFLIFSFKNPYLPAIIVVGIPNNKISTVKRKIYIK